MPLALGRELLQQEFVVVVEEEQVDHAKHGVVCKHAAVFDDARNLVIVIDRVG